MEQIKPIKITDIFRIGDRVTWMKAKKTRGTIEIRNYSGIIKEIEGTRALIRSRYFKRIISVSLFELKKIGR